MPKVVFDQSRASALEKLHVPPITEPFSANVLWARITTECSRDGDRAGLTHNHSFFEAHFVLDGHFVYEHDGKAYNLKDGMGLVFAPGQKHRRVSCTDNAQRLSIAWTSEQSPDAFGALSGTRVQTFPISNGQMCDIAGIYHEFERKSSMTPLLVRNKIVSLISAFADAPDTAFANETDDLRLEQATRYIEDNSHLFLTCADVANYCHFNVKYLGRIFKQSTGMTLLEYIHSQKRSCAEALLVNSDMSLAEIATSLGFKNEYYFNAFFKRVQGVTPGEYRRLVKKTK